MGLPEFAPSFLPDGLLAQILRHTQEGIIALDGARRCLLWNGFMERATGVTAGAVLGRRLADVLPDLDRNGTADAITRTLTGQQAPPSDVVLRMRSAPRRLTTTYTTLRTPSGGIAGALITFADVHTQSERALRDADERTKAALAATSTAVWELDLQRGEVVWSANLDALVKRALDRFDVVDGLRSVHPADAAHVRAACMATLKTREPYSVEFRVIWPDGTVRWLLSAGRVIEALDGKPPRLIGSTVDVTERHALEMQLRQSQKMDAVGRLAGGVAHDFNNLLTVIQGYAQLVADKALEPKQAAEIGEVLQATERATLLTRQLLAFSRQQVLDPAAYELNALVTELMGLMRRLIGADIELVVKLGDDVGSVWADKGQIGQVIMNLVVNARDAMPMGGCITVETDRMEISSAVAVAGAAAGRYARLMVRDTGMGMSEETKARIFEPFFTTKERGKGTGLGLSTVYGIVTQSSGHIRVQSEPGSGCTFEVWLPITDQGVRQRPVAIKQPEHRVAAERVVLVIEDQAAVRALVRRILEREGFGVLEAADSLDAEAIFEEHRDQISLVVTDVVMPGEKGPDLFRRLAVRKPELRVVYMSGHIEETVFGEGGRGRERFLAKPFTAAGLIGVVQDALRD
jgi:two-component system, cell cycle sensor histidine kinase and response regulator CckA